MLRHAARAAGLVVVLALLAAAQDRPSFKGELKPGGSQAFPLPAAAKGFWRLVLEAEAAGADLDLRVVSDGRALAVSRGEGGDEEVLVAALKGLRAVVDHVDGPRTAFSLRLEPVAPGRKLVLGKSTAGEVDAARAPFAVHELPATGTKFCAVSLEAAGAGEGVDLDLYVYDQAWRLLTSSTGEEADEEVVLSPGREARWVVVRAWEGRAAYALSAAPLGEDARRLGTDETVKGTLERGGARFFRLRTTQPGIVTVRLEGPKDQDLDLHVFGPDGYYRESIDEDSQEEVAINGAKRGDYLVRVSGGDDAARGDFTLTTERLDLTKLAPHGRGGSKTWGLFVGIAAYEEVDKLTYTAGDALSVYQLLCAVGQAERSRSIVLLDELARRRDLVKALEEIAARADEDDVFVFFFSGHAGNDAPDGARGDPKDEEDGGDEYLVCFDSNDEGHSGDLIDDDLKVLLDKIKCKQQFIFLDACHSGGFAELIDREGRYGCFSSLESQTSTEALALKKGLLTAILLRGLSGEADADGDGKVTLGELSAFVERVQPNTCGACQDALTPEMTRCRGCGEDLTQPDARQIPVIVDRAGADVVLTTPGARRGATAQARRRP
ncbi:MAG: caspase family protein [Planctomycetes bacterium]|nr:caspase family protein [Planctomycetota bacterium]